jgi:regulator of nucleoside diphosphate kinase
MKRTKNKLYLTTDDFQILNSYLRGVTSVMNFDQANAGLLKEELKKAIIVKNDKLPENVIRLNSRVVVKEHSADRLIELELVIPEKANISEKKISVFAPLGTALIGFSQGQKVIWDLPAGTKTFTIVHVDNGGV